MTNLNNSTVKYRILVENRVLGEHSSKVLAEVALSSLSEDERSKAQIIPVMEDGKQFLLG